MSWWLSFASQKNGRTLTGRSIFAWCAMGPNNSGGPRLRVLHQVLILSGCSDSRGHLNSIVGLPNLNKGSEKIRKCLLALLALVLICYVPANSQELEDAMSPDLVASAQAFVDLLAKRDFSSAES